MGINQSFILGLNLMVCLLIIPKKETSWKPAIPRPHWWHCQSRWLTQDPTQVGASLWQAGLSCTVHNMLISTQNWSWCYLHSIRSSSDSFSESFAFKSRMSLWREKEANSSHRGILTLQLLSFNFSQVQLWGPSQPLTPFPSPPCRKHNWIYQSIL